METKKSDTSTPLLSGHPTPSSSITSESIAEGSVDVGFDSIPFDHGRINILDPTEELLKNPPKVGTGTEIANVAITLGCAVTVIGIPYLLKKLTLVKQGELGLCRTIFGSVRLLTPGLHLKSTMCSDVRKFDQTDDEVHFGPMHIVRVLPGWVGCSTINGNPVIMRSGRHVVNDPLFNFIGRVKETESHIQCGTVHVITVSAGDIATCTVGGVGHFLGDGRHFINNPLFKFAKIYAASSEYIKAGNKHRILVPKGRLGLVWQDGMPIVLNPGKLYRIVSDTLKYEKSVDIATKFIEHGSIRIITVPEGEVGISYDDGVLKVLNAGRHVLDKPTHIFRDFISTGQRTLPIEEVRGMSADNIGLQFDAAITCRVVDAKKAVTMLAFVESGDSSLSSSSHLGNIYKNIQKKARLALAIIIGNNRFSSSFRATSSHKRVSAGESADASSLGPEVDDTAAGEEGEGEEMQGGNFKQHVHDIFMARFSEEMRETCGVKVIDMSIEDIQITTKELRLAMTKSAVAERELEMAKIQRRVMATNAMSAANAESIKAEGKARAMSILANAAADRIRALNEAMSEAGKITQERELIRAAGEVLKESKSTMLVTESVSALPALLAGKAMSFGE